MLFFSIWAIANSSTQAQNYIFRNYQADNGLAQNTVFAITQTEDGFMWFGTKAGLNRFDGYSFKIFSTQDFSHNGLNNNYIKSIVRGDGGHLWVGTIDGLYKFNIVTEKFTLIEVTKGVDINSLTKDNNGNIWYLANGAISLFNDKSKFHNQFNFTNSEKPSCISFVNNQIYLGLKNGKLKKYNTSDRQFHTVDINYIPISSRKGISALEAVDQNRIVVGISDVGVFLYNLASKRLQPLFTHDAFNKKIIIRDILFEGNKIWVASESGIFIYNLISKTISHLQKDLYTPNTISDNAIYSLYKDKQGAIWIGTFFKGVDYCLPDMNRIKNYYPSKKAGDLNGSFVREIVKDKNDIIWIGTEDAGIFTFNRNTQRFTKIHLNDVENVHGLAIEGNRIWVGTFHDGLFVVDIHTKKALKHYDIKLQNGIKVAYIEVICRLKSGEILAGTPAGLYILNQKTDKFESFSKIPQKYHFKTILQSANGDIWAGSSKSGVYHYSKKNNKLYHYKSDDKTGSISNNFINYIYEDSNKNIWVCTENGLNLYNSKNQNFKAYYKKDGFSSSVFYTIVEYTKDNYWLSTNRGVSNFRTHTNTIENYGKNNGLLANQFSYSSVLYDKQNAQIYFGSINGLLTLFPNSFKTTNYKSPVYLTNFQILGQKGDAKSNQYTDLTNIAYAKKINLPYDKASFSVEFSALNFESPDLVTYAYKLSGASDDWIAINSERKVNFTNLKPGNYQFQVKAGAHVQALTSTSRSVFIHISPPFYLSTLAYSIYALLLILSIVVVLKLYNNWLNINQKIKMEAFEKQVQKEVYQSKIEFFTQITHEIKTPLTLIKGPLDELLKDKKFNSEKNRNLQIIDKNTDRLLTLTKELLDFRKIEKENYHLNFVKLNIIALLGDCYIRYANLAKSKNIIYTFKNRGEDFFAFADKEALNKILSNLIDNAIKYAESKVELSIEESNDHRFNIIVSNDGEIIPQNMQAKLFEPFFRLENHKHIAGNGLGLSLSQSLAQLHEGSLTVHTKNPFNVFVLNLPVHHDIEFGRDELITSKDDTSAVDEKESMANPQNLPHILVVDDNPEILSFLNSILAQKYHISKATSVREALKIQSQFSIKLIISDVMMPEVDGYEFCTMIKENLNTSHIPLILLTAKTSMQAKVEGLNTGADAYIEKPFSAQHLMAQVQTLLNNRELIKTYYANTPTAHLNSIAFNKTDEEFLIKIDKIIEQNLNSALLCVDFIADKLNMSRGTFYRKIKAVSNLSPNELILVSRLKIAAELLAENRYKIYEVSNKTGFSSQAQFTRNFTKQFRCTPSEYVEGLKNKAINDKIL